MTRGNDPKHQEAHATCCSVNSKVLPISAPAVLVLLVRKRAAGEGLFICKESQVPDSSGLACAHTYLDGPEPRGVPVALVSLGCLLHRNDQADLGFLETQHFPLCLWVL